ncbi:Ankyrin repeat-containing protein [Oryctes borbonicus]|uniref:Ankyrin repeat-containing protein n=1 Tax=Oryctes borbonicus TaxID=1629725 RepID=A0A0T6BH64_9SCAR|nr:Ankyrin repeat-containing protein [Oryctes borbonicus]
MTSQILNTEVYLKEFVLKENNSCIEEWRLIDDQKEIRDFKILKITTETVDDVLYFMKRKLFRDTYNQATHWFFTVIKVTTGPLLLTPEYLSSELAMLDNVRPVIIQWESKESGHLIFFRQSGHTRFCLIDINTNEILIETEFASQHNFNFPLLLRALQNKMGGYFNGNLLDATLDVKQEFDKWRFLDYSAKNDDSLSMRFLMLFGWDLNERNEDGLKVLEIAAEYAGPQTMAALLDMPIINAFTMRKLFSIGQKELLLATDAINNSPLVIAVEKGKADTLTFLIDCGLDINYRTKSLLGQEIVCVELAWNQKRYDNVLVLLRSDSSYPSEYDVSLLKGDVNIALKKFTEEVVEFHNALRKGKKCDIVRFIENYPNLRKVHDLNNQSALMTALLATQYDIFTYLQSKGFTVTESESLPMAYESLNDQQKEDLKQAKLKYFRKQDNAHITFLLSKSKAHLARYDNHHLASIEDLFQQLDDVPEMSTIMKVLEHSESIEITFCFGYDSSTHLKTCSTANDYRRGRLFVDTTDSQQALHTLAKGLAHLAIQYVYKNDLNPFAVLDKQNGAVFKEIVDKNRNHLESLDPIFGEVFSIYPNSTDWLSELIVRVPLSLVRYGQKVEQHKEHVAELYAFYENQVQKDFLKCVADPIHFKCEYKIECLNDLLGELHKIQKSKIWLKEECLLGLDIFHLQTLTVVASSLSNLVKCDLYQILTSKSAGLNIASHCIFATSTHIKNKMEGREIYDLYKSSVKPMLVVSCTCDDVNASQDFWISIDKFRDKERIIIIVKKLFEKNYSSFKATIINKQYKWSDLSIETQSFLLQKPINFQGHKITLSEIAIAEVSVINLIPLEMLIDDKEIKIGEPLPISYGFNETLYIKRTFNSQLVMKDTIIDDVSKGKISCRLAYTKIKFQKLCETYPLSSIHWISKEDTGQLIWHKSHSDIKELAKYIDTVNQRLFPQEDIWKLLQRARHQKIMIISGMAGVGKTTVFTYLSKEITQNFPTHWVVFVNLNLYNKELEKQCTRKMKTLQFLVEELMKLNSPLEKIVFEHLLISGRVILMLDGFDEVCPRYKAILIDLLLDLSTTQIEQIWISTRPHLQFDLESRLNQLSYGLESFSEPEQIDFLIKFWGQTLNLPTEPDKLRIKLYAEALLDKLMQSIKDDTKIFAGIPLQIRMLAEAFSHELSDFYFTTSSTLPELPEKLDLLTVYEKFLHNKYRIYTAEKNKPLNTVATKDIVGILKGGVNLRKLHQQMALEVLFPQKKEAILQRKKIHYLPQEQLNRMGIVQYVGSNKLYFIHRTFAEYYVADFFATELAGGSSNAMTTEQFLLTELLLQPDLRIIRVFLDALLSKVEYLIPLTITISYGNRIEELWKTSRLRESGNSILYVAVAEKNISIIKFLLNSLKVGKHKETLRSLLLYRGNYDRVSNNQRTVMCQAACDNYLNMLDTLRLWSEEAQLNSVSEFVRLFFTKNETSTTLWHEIAKRCHANVFDKLYKWAVTVIDSTYLKSLFLHRDTFRKTAWHHAIDHENFEILAKLWCIAQEINLEPKELKDMLLNTDIDLKNAWHYAACKKECSKILQNLNEWANLAQLNCSEIKQIFLGANGRTVWRSAVNFGIVENMVKIWELGKSIPLTDKELKYVLLSTNDMHETVCGDVARMGDVNVLQKIRIWADELKLNNEELKALLFTSNKEHTNVWQTASSEAYIDILWKIAQELRLSEGELRQMLLGTNTFGENAWLAAIKKGQPGIVEKVWICLKRISLSTTELRQVVLQKNQWKINLMQLIADLQDEKVLRKLLVLFEDIFTLEEISDMLISRVNQKKTLWHHASLRGNLKVLNAILEWGNKKLNGEMLENFLNAKETYESRMFLISTWNGLSLEKVLKWCKENLPLNDFKKVILGKRLLGTYAWKQNWKGEKEVIEDLLCWSKENLSTKELVEIMRMTDYVDQTLFRVILESCMEVLMSLWDWNKDLEITTHFRRLFIWHGNGVIIGTVLHSTMRKRNTELLIYLWKWIQHVQLTEKELKEIVFTRDYHGDMFLHLVSRLNTVSSAMDILNDILDRIKTVLKSQILQELLMTKDLRGQNILHSLAYSKQSVELLQLLRWCIKNLTRDQFKELMLDRCRGETVLHVLAQESVKGWFDVIEWLERNLEFDIFSELFLAVNNQKRHSMKVAEVRIAEGRIKGTIDEEMFNKSGDLRILEIRCKEPGRELLALPP